MNSFGLFWSMYDPSRNEFFSMVVPKILSGPADDAQREGLPIQKVGAVALIPIEGAMVKTAYWSFLASMTHVTKAVKSATADQEVEIIVLVMDSPGGNVDGLAELGDAVNEAAKVKTVIAQVQGMSMSANYYVASQAHKIYTGRNDLVGSIGTRIMLVDYSEYFSKEGIKVIPVDTGEFKSAGAMGTKITEAQIKDFQRIVDGYFEDFLQMVEGGREMTREKLLKAADGRVFFPDEAKKLGLIDGVQTLEQTIAPFINSKPKGGRKTQAAREMLNLL